MGGDPRLEMHNDPRMMMHGDPRMGQGDLRMMFGCRPRGWMFRHMMQNAASSEDENTVSEGGEHQSITTKARREKMREQRKEFRKMAREMGWFPRRWGFPQSDSDAEKSDDAGERDLVQQEALAMSREEVRERREKMREEMRGKRQTFRKLVREIGVYPWMFKALAQELYGSKKSDDATKSVEKPQEEEMVDEEQKKLTENKEKFLQILKELGAYPWMFRVLANQRALAPATTGSESEGDSPPEGAAIRGRRKMFRQIAKPMGWTSESDGEKDQSDEGGEEENERRKEERQRIREVRREMAWMPWMQMMSGRHHHHHRHHHRHSPPRHGDSPRRHQHHHHNGDRRHHHHHEGGHHHAQ